MIVGLVDRAVGTHAVPRSVRALSSLPDLDYADLFTLSTGTESWFLTGNLVVQTADGRVSLATFLHYDRCLGRGWWPPLSAIHRRLVPGVLRGAAARAAIRC